MKMTMHIDDALLERVIRLTGASSKTEAVSIALKEMDRRARLAEFGKNGIGLTKAEMLAAVDPSYDLMAMRVAEGGGQTGGSTYKAPKKKAPAKKKPR
jgi:Arc/MetJ family transcription regulator